MEYHREDIEEEIASITAQLKGPLPNIERAWLVSDRKDLREILATLPAPPGKDG